MRSMITGMVFRKTRPQVGARPGTLAISEDAVPPKVRMINFTESEFEEEEVETIADMASAHRSDDVTWIDVQGFGDESLLRGIAKEFSIHPLALEDVVHVPQRPKCEAYDEQLLIIVRMIHNDGAIDIRLEQVAIVLGDNYVLTFQEWHGDVLDPVRNRLRKAVGRMRSSHADYLAYAILDTIVDAYYPVLEDLGEHLESLETLVLEHTTPNTLQRLNRTKNTLVNLRRAIWPQREAVSTLMRAPSDLVSDAVRLHLRDTHDHCVQTSEVLEMYREMSSGLMNTYLSAIANRTNEVMKILTIMASIFIPLTFLAGVYGMNFEHMPELHYRWSYPLVWATMFTVSAGMLIYFRRLGWLGGETVNDAEE